jgi:hypothetical protein
MPLILALIKPELRKKSVVFSETHMAGYSPIPIFRSGEMRDAVNFSGSRVTLARINKCWSAESLMSYVR